MKRIFSLIIALCLTLPLMLFTACSNEENNEKGSSGKEITVFSWEDYIDEGYETADLEDLDQAVLDRFSEEQLTTSVLDIFEEKTGIKVNYYTFANNEEMYNELIKDPDACDLVCPSEYMILKMRNEGLIKPFTMPESYSENGSPYIKHMFNTLKLNDETDASKTYALGYMWGTMGLIYDADKYSAEDFKLWSYLLTNEDFSDKLTIKDSLRDSYIMALAIVYEEELLTLKKDYSDNKINSTEYESKIAEIFNRTDAETIEKAQEVLAELKANQLYGFEVDAGKNDLLSGRIDVNFAWSGDAVFSMNEGDLIGRNLGYAVPETGSNVWFDGWVMTKSANEEYASKFLDFICEPDNVIRNMAYIGYTSCVGGDEVFSYIKDVYNEDDGTNQVSLKYFFDWNNENSNDYIINVSDENMGRQLYAQYADRETIERCAVMDNFDDESLQALNLMWSKVKLITLKPYAIAIIITIIVLAILAVILFKYKAKIFKKSISAKQTKPRRKGYKVISIREKTL